MNGQVDETLLWDFIEVFGSHFLVFIRAPVIGKINGLHI